MSTDDPDSTDLVAARLLRTFRRDGGWTQQQMAEMAGLSLPVISAWEDGTEQPTLGALIRLIEACGSELRLHVSPRDRHDEALLHRTTEKERLALAAEERTRIENLEVERLADRLLGDLLPRPDGRPGSA